jgi:excisionase family DNA binding protein
MKKNNANNANSITFFENLIWLNSSEAAEYLRISVENLRLKVHRGQLKAKYLNSRLRFRKSELDDLLDSSL